MGKRAANDLHYRSIPLRGQTGAPATFDRASRSVQITGITEAPVPMWYPEYGGVIPEVLLSRGFQPPPAGQVPLVDTHDRSSVRNVLGSFRQPTPVEDRVDGTVYFSSVPDAQEAMTKVEEGHLTDFSGGYRVHSHEFVPEGKQAKIAGRTWQGPIVLATSWSLREMSICPIGADENAKARAEGVHVAVSVTLDEKEEAMTDVEKQELERLRKLEADLREKEQGGGIDTDIQEMRARDAAERVRARKAELARHKAISTECAKWEGKGFDLGDLEAELIRDGTSEDLAVRRINDLVRTQIDKRDKEFAFAGPITVTADERDKFRSYGVAGVLTRAGYGDLVDEKLRTGHDLVGMHLRDLMLKAGRMANAPELGWSQRSLSSSDFPYILADSQNKIMAAKYAGAAVTWRAWCRKATTSRVDNGTMPVVSFLSKARHLKLNDGAYEFLKQSDAAETYVMDKIGGMIHVSEEAILNDDLMAISNQAGNLGDVIARGVNIKVYGDGTAEDYGTLVGSGGVGETMRDATALFTSGHANYVGSGSGAAPGSATLSAAKAALRIQKDIGGNYPLNTQAGFLILPSALEEVGIREVSSEYLLMVGTASAVTERGQKNPHYGTLEPVVEPLLDLTGVAGAATRWYVAAANRDLNPWVIFHESTDDRPALDSRMEWLNDGMTWKGNVKVAVKAPDWRGLFCNYGA